MCIRVTQQSHVKYFDIFINTGTALLISGHTSFLKVQNADALETSTTNPTEIFQTPHVSQNLRNNGKPWFQTEILSMM